MKKEITTLMLCALIFLGGSNFEAKAVEALQQKPQQPVKMKKISPADMEKRTQEFNKALNLTPAQIEKAKQIRMSGHKKMKPLMDKKKAKQEEIRSIMNNKKLSVKNQEKKIKSVKKELHQIDIQMRQIRKDNEKEFENILTEEQKAKYNEIKIEGRKHFKEHKMPQKPENFIHRHP